TRVSLGEDVVDGLAEDVLGTGALVGERRPRLLLHHAEHLLVSPRLREPQVNELEQRFEILRRGKAAEAFFVGADRRRHARYDAGELPPELERGERADAAGRDDLRRRAGRHEEL